MLRNKLFLIVAFALVCSGLLLGVQGGQPPSSPANGPVQGVIPPLPDSQQPPNADKTSDKAPTNPPQSHGQVEGGVLMPLPEDQQPENADKGATPPPANPPTQPENKSQDQGGGLLMPLPENQQPENADKGGTPPPANPPNQPGDTVQVPVSPNGAGQAPSGEVNGVYVFKKEVEEVILHATVVDDHYRLVTNLQRGDFTVFEDGKPQQITSFRHEDIPVALGIVIDNSGSMRDKRPAVNQAAINLVKSSNPEDEVFVVNFNDEYWLDQDFTGDIGKLQTALERIETRGGTALYDAIVASADHLKKNARLEKKVLLVVTDGEDNASRETLEQAIHRLKVENGPTVYTIGILGGESHQRRAKRALQEIAEDTGGVAFFPKDLSEVDNITHQVARDIRNQYSIGYKPSTPQSAGGYRTIRVLARARGYNKLQVRTRSGYYAGRERASR
jgi:VWFA-related protein